MQAMGRLLAACLTAAWVLAACVARPPAPVVGPPEVMNRAPLPSCGEERRQRQRDPLNQEARLCLLEAFSARQPAEFISEQLTVEGDPVLELYRVWDPVAGVPVVLYVDMTRDSFGSGSWQRLVCGALVAAPPPVVFHNADCRDEVEL